MKQYFILFYYLFNEPDFKAKEKQICCENKAITLTFDKLFQIKTLKEFKRFYYSKACGYTTVKIVFDPLIENPIIRNYIYLLIGRFIHRLKVLDFEVIIQQNLL